MIHDPVIHLVDDDADVRHALAFALTTSGWAVRVYASAEAFLASWPGTQAGCLVADLRMPGMDGLELIQHLRALDPDFPAIMMTGHGDIRLAVAAMKAGASDFIEKPFDDATLRTAIGEAIGKAGNKSEQPVADRPDAGRRERLTQRENEVLDGLLDGHSNKTIALALGISPRTVETHRASIMMKMAVKSLPELVRACIV